MTTTIVEASRGKVTAGAAADDFYSKKHAQPADKGPAAASLVQAGNRTHSYLFATPPELLDGGVYANLLRKRIDFRFNGGSATDDPSDPKNWVQLYSDDRVLQGVWLERRARRDHKTFWPDLKAPCEVPASQYTVGHDLPARCLFPQCSVDKLRCERDEQKIYRTVHGIPHAVKFYHHKGREQKERNRDLNNVQWTDYRDYNPPDEIVESRRGVDPHNWGMLDAKRRRWMKEKLGDVLYNNRTEYFTQYSSAHQDRIKAVDAAIDCGKDLLEIYCSA